VRECFYDQDRADGSHGHDPGTPRHEPEHADAHPGKHDQFLEVPYRRVKEFRSAPPVADRILNAPIEDFQLLGQLFSCLCDGD